MVSRAGISNRRFEEVFSATEANVTADELSVAPGPGAVGVWTASDAVDGLITVRIGNKIPANRQTISDRGTDVPINTEDQAPDGFAQVSGGERITVDYVEATAASARIIVIWVGVDRGFA